MARLAPLAFLFAALLSILSIGTSTAHADGKVFLSIASDPSGSASATMPRQRAIIAFKDGVQHLAIDTSFVGPGDEFAWLVPLPSEPEILPATKGMFDTAAMVTAPRVSNRGAPIELTIAGVLVMLCIVVALLTSTRRLGALVAILIIVAVAIMMLPALSGARSSLPNLAVDVLDQRQVGLYETVVLRGQNADGVIGWLEAEGFASPSAATEVVQAYLDRGWVFAAAKLRDDSTNTGERRAHPLQFRFQTDKPIYPMALTAVGNESIALELFVFAEGKASTRDMRRWNALETQPDDRDYMYRRGASYLRGRPGTIAHPGLIDVAMGLPMLTRLSGELSPERQRKDILLEIGEASPENPLLRTSGARWSIVAASAVWGAVGTGLVALLLIGVTFGKTRESALSSEPVRRSLLGATVVAGVAVGVWVFVTTPTFAGEVRRGSVEVMLDRQLEQAAMTIEARSIDEGVSTPREIDALRDAVFSDIDIEPQTGDSPLHYRIEFNDDETEARFIWHDLIGAEHRVVMPLVGDGPDDGATP